ncbi:MAG: TIGR04255 family protein [Bacteroidia bacterium]|nr:TIGR04255 family protein [Bacteroidia bacterium]
MFGFPVNTRPANFHFSKNFLRSVSVQIKYAKNENIVNQKAALLKLLSEKFPNSQDLQSQKIQIKNINNKTEVIPSSTGVSGILFETKNSLQSINISETFILIGINGSVYTNLETLWNTIEGDLMSIFNICGIKQLEWVSIRKINVFQFELQPDTKPLEGISAVFNKALISNFLTIPGGEFMFNGISNITLKNGTNNLNLTLGLVPSQETKKSLILDIDVYCIEEGLAVEKLKERIFEINQEIFNVFSWSLQDQMIKQLQS